MEMRCVGVILGLALMSCDKEPAAPPPASNAVTGNPKFSGPVTFRLGDAEARHREAPSTFEIPTLADRQNVGPEDTVKLIFEITDGSRTEVERMWVQVTSAESGRFEGILDNDPYCTDELRSGEKVGFEARHIIQIDPK